MLLAGILQVTQARATGGATGLLQAGAKHPLAERIADQMPDMSFTDGIGHDGQIFYAMGLDLLAHDIPNDMRPVEEPGYRYRRILYPMISSLGGALDGYGLLWGMIGTSILAVGIASSSAAAIGMQLGMGPWLGLTVLANPGVWLSARLLTADNLALGLSLLAVAAFLHKWRALTIVFLALAVLTKEPTLALSVGLAGYLSIQNKNRRDAMLLMVGSALPLTLWTFFIGSSTGDPLSTSGNLTPPFVGIASGIQHWLETDPRDTVWGTLTLISLVASIKLLWRADPLWKWLAWSWVAIAIVASELVWTLGNNAIRTLAPVLTLTAMGLWHHSTSREPSVT